jgi:hypothetical protein
MFRYLWATSYYVICYQEDGNKKLKLHGFVDDNWVGDTNNEKLTDLRFLWWEWLI